MAARTANHAGHEGVEDVATVSLSFVSGAEAHLTSVWHDIMTRGSTRRVEVFCREGMVWLEDEFRGPLHLQTSEGTEVRPCPSPEWVDGLPLTDDEVGLAVRAYVEADRGFVDAVTGGWAPDPGLDVALAAHRLVDAAYRSAAGGGVPLDVAGGGVARGVGRAARTSGRRRARTSRMKWSPPVSSRGRSRGPQTASHQGFLP